jgi:hypothetical protein
MYTASCTFLSQMAAAKNLFLMNFGVSISHRIHFKSNCQSGAAIDPCDVPPYSGSLA